MVNLMRENGEQNYCGYYCWRFGGLACVTVNQPLDTVKVKQQTFPSLYKTMRSTFAKTLREEGFRGFYSGCGPAFMASISDNAVVFMAYGYSQRVVQWVTRTDEKDMTVLHKACSGSLASVFSSIAITPPDILKSRLQAQKALLERAGITTTKRLSTWCVVKNIMKDDGPAGFFRGLTGTWAREIPGYFVMFASYEFTRKHLAPARADDNAVWRTALCGGVAGCCFWTAMFPVDVTKTRIQVKGERSSGFWRTFVNIVRTEGIVSLYRGLLPILIGAFPANAALFTVFEYTKEVMSRPLFASP